MSAGIPQVGGVGAPDIARVPAWGQPDVSRPDIARVGEMSQPALSRPDILGGARMQDPISAAYAHLQGLDAGLRVGPQAPIPMSEVPKFSPLAITLPSPTMGAVQGAPARISGLQRLLLEKLG